MGEVARNPVALELLRVQRNRLADRLRPPWWYLPGSAIAWAVGFTGQFSLRYLPRVDYWATAVATAAVWFLLQWGLTRATGISVGMPDLTYRPGRPARIAMLVVSLGALVTEHFLIDRGLLVAAVVVAVLAVVAGVVGVQAALRGIRQNLRDGGGTA